MFKKIASLLLVTLFLFGIGTFSASARLSYTNMAFTALILKNGKATCSASLEGYPGTTTKVSIVMTLQKRTLLLFWSDEVTWSQTTSGYYAILEKTASISSGTYRTKAIYTNFFSMAMRTASTLFSAPSLAYNPCRMVFTVLMDKKRVAAISLRESP